MNEKHDWIITIHDEALGTRIVRFYGTDKEVKRKLMILIKLNREIAKENEGDYGEFEYGTDDTAELMCTENQGDLVEAHGYNGYEHNWTDFVTTRLDTIKSI